jgi:hypothetical protein
MPDPSEIMNADSSPFDGEDRSLNAVIDSTCDRSAETGAAHKSDESRGESPSPKSWPQERDPTVYDPYEPWVYRCIGYDKDTYVWFDGVSTAQDKRFFIDLEHGTMDK